MNSELQRDVGMIEGLVSGEGSPVHVACWQRLKPRLNPDRERVARAIAEAVDGDGELPWQSFLPEADAAIAAMGEP